MDKNETVVVKPKKDKFKWFVAILVFIVAIIFIVSGRPKNNFESCYEKCASLATNEASCIKLCK